MRYRKRISLQQKDCSWFTSNVLEARYTFINKITQLLYSIHPGDSIRLGSTGFANQQKLLCFKKTFLCALYSRGHLSLLQDDLSRVAVKLIKRQPTLMHLSYPGEARSLSIEPPNWPMLCCLVSSTKCDSRTLLLLGCVGPPTETTDRLASLTPSSIVSTLFLEDCLPPLA